MFNITKLRGRARQSFLYFIEMTVVTVSLSFLLLTYRTFGDVVEPITIHEPAIIAVSKLSFGESKTAGGSEVLISRDMTFNSKDTPVTVSTSLINEKSNFSIDLRDARISSPENGRTTLQRLYYVSHLTSGKWCIQTKLFWTPFLSLRERTSTSKKSCFDVE